MNLVRATREAVERRMSIADFDSILDMMSSGGAPSYTGKLVSPKNALGVSAVWACVNVIADDLAATPFPVYRWSEPGVARDEARDHYLWPLLMEEANSRMSAFDFKQAMEIWRLLWGNCFAEIEMNGRGQVLALWPMRPDRVKVWLDDPGDIRSQVWYTYRPMDQRAQPMTLPADRVLHIRHTSIDGITGLSPIEIHRQTIGLMMAMQEHAGRFYSNGASIKGVLSHPGTLGTKGQETLRESMKYYEGLSNAHRMLILEEGMTFKETAMKMDDAQFIETQGYNVTDVARIFKVPPHRIQDLSRATFSNIEQESLDYVQTTQIPICANWGGRIHCSLLSARERDSIFMEPDFTHMLMGDHAARGNYFTAMNNAGILSIDEMRQKEGYNPLPKGLGKLPRVQLNTMPLQTADQPKTTPAPTQNAEPAPTKAPKKPNGAGVAVQ